MQFNFSSTQFHKIPKHITEISIFHLYHTIPSKLKLKLEIFKSINDKRCRNQTDSNYLSQETEQGLHVISSHRVTNKGQRLPSHEVQEPGRAENLEIAVIGLPPPLHVPIIGPPVLHTVLVVLYEVLTCQVGVVRPIWIRHPFACEQIALLLGGFYLVDVFVGWDWEFVEAVREIDRDDYE